MAKNDDQLDQVYGRQLDADQKSAVIAEMKAKAQARKPPPDAQTDAAAAEPADQKSIKLPSNLFGVWDVAKTWRAMKGVGEDIATTVEHPGDAAMSAMQGIRDAGIQAPGALAHLAYDVPNEIGAFLLNPPRFGPVPEAVRAQGKAAADALMAETRRGSAYIDEATKALDAAIPQVAEAHTGTEGFIQGTTQFLAGLAATHKLVPGKIGGTAGADMVVRNAAANVLAFDPKDPTLGNLVQQYFPQLKDSWETATSIDAGDSTGTDMLKRAADSLGMDAIGGVLGALAGIVRSGKRAAKIKADAGEAGGEVRDKSREIADQEAEAERAVAGLGDPAAPAVSDGPSAAPRMFQGETNPEQQAVRVEAAARRAGVLDEPAPEISQAEAEAEAIGMGGTPRSVDQILEMMDQAKAGERPRPLATFVRSQGGIADTPHFAGEIDAIGGKKLKNKNGVDFETMAERAAEAGYIPLDENGRYDVNQFIDALRDDIQAEDAGDIARRAYSINDATAAAKLPDLLRLQRELQDMGVDWSIRGKNKRRAHAAQAAEQATFTGAPRTLDDLDAVQNQIDAAGTSGFRPYDDTTLGPDPALDASGLFDPEAASKLDPLEMKVQLGRLSDSEVLDSAEAYLGAAVKTPDQARILLLSKAMAGQETGIARDAGKLSPEERAAVLDQTGEEGGEGPAAGLDEGGEGGQPTPEEPPWKTAEGKRQLAQRVLKMPESMQSFILDEGIKNATDAEHRAAMEEVRQLVENTKSAKFADSAEDAFVRAERALQPTRPLSRREASLLDETVAAGGDLWQGLKDRGIRDDAAAEMVAHAVADERVGIARAVRAAADVSAGRSVRGDGQTPDFRTKAHIAPIIEAGTAQYPELAAKLAGIRYWVESQTAAGRKVAVDDIARALGMSHGAVLQDLARLRHEKVLLEIDGLRPHLWKTRDLFADGQGGRTPSAIDDAELEYAAGTKPDPRGRKSLSEQQFEVFKLAREGKGNKEIAEILGGPEATKSTETIATVLAQIRRKGFDVERLKGPVKDPKTLRIIELRAQNLPYKVIAERIYPEVDLEVAERRVNALIAKNKEAIAKRRSELSADSKPGAPAGNAQTPREMVNTLMARITEDFGTAGEQLIRSGAVVLHRSANTVPTLTHATTEAVYSNGVVHILANRITPQRLYGLMLHEVGAHAGLRDMLGGDVYDAIAANILKLAGEGDQAAWEASRRVHPRTLMEHVPDELIAYYIQGAPRDASIWRRIEGAIRAWLYKTFPKAANLIKPTSEALRQMAVKSLRRYAKLSIDREYALGGDNDFIGFYSGVDRGLRGIEGDRISGDELMARLREQPGVNEEELQNLGIESWLQGRASVSMAKVRQFVDDRRLFLDRSLTTVRGVKGDLRFGRTDGARDVIFRLPEDVPGGQYSASGSPNKGVLSVARLSDRRASDGRKVTFLENLDSDIHPLNGYGFTRPEVIDPAIAERQDRLLAEVEGLQRPLDFLEGQGTGAATSLPEYQAWRTKRQELLNDIAEHGDHIGYIAGQIGRPFPPAGTPLKNWATTTIRNLLASTSVTDAEGFAIPTPAMFRDLSEEQKQFWGATVKDALEQAAKDLDLDVSTTPLRMGRLGEPEAPVIWLDDADRARIVQTGVPLYADARQGQAPGSIDPPNQLNVAAPGGRKIYVNLARVAADGDIKGLIQSLANRYAGEINKARGGERQADADLLASSAQVDAWETLRSRRSGEPLGAKESLAARQLWAASADWVSQISKRYLQSKSPADKFALNQAIAVHRAIQAEVVSARTETARALRSWALPAGSTAEKLNQMQGILTMHGVDHADELAGRLAVLGPDQVGMLDEVVEKSLRAKTSDVLGELWRSALLSSPKTHLVNLLSNTAVLSYDVAETAVSGIVGRALGNPAMGEMVGEAAQKWAGVMAAYRAQMKFFHENRRFSTTAGAHDVVAGTKVDAAHANAISSEAFGLNPESQVGAAADVVGRVINTPQALLGGADDFFKGVNYMGELYGRAHRAAADEVHAGLLERDAMGARIAELVDQPSEEMQIAARQAAQERTFTTPPRYGGVVSAMFKARDWMNGAGLPLGHFVLPFINTPANIMKWTFSRTPAGLLMREMQQKLQAGGKTAQLAKVQMAMGTMGLSLAWELAASNQITGGGPVNAGDRQLLERNGWQPYSVRVGDHWVSYQRFDPLATFLAIGADLHEIIANRDYTNNGGTEIGEVVAQSMGAIGNSFLSKTYLQGVSDFNAFLGDPRRYGERYLENIAASMAGPAGIAEIRRQVDPAMRDVHSIATAIKNRWPGASESLPAARDLWGRPRMYQSHWGMAYDAMSPFAARKIDPAPVDKELMRLRYAPQLPGRSISVPIGGRSVMVPLNNRPDIYNRVLELSGDRALKMANDLVQSAGYQGLQDSSEPLPGTKAYAIETIILRNRTYGRQLALREYWGDLQDLARKELARELEATP
ncbi:MAG: hypothetical protein GC155_06265 [Alphaproteobacteria bacterium]|nr:hypothetical protein [Alphaproteobacteria bacterium]